MFPLIHCPKDDTAPIRDLYTQVKDYILTTWSPSCIKYDHNNFLQANNGHLYIWFSTRYASTPFLVLRREQSDSIGIIFDGYIRNLDDFKLILDLTSAQKQSWDQ